MDQNNPSTDAASLLRSGSGQASFDGQVPPPPQTPEVKLRTMQSDFDSIEKTGGAAPTPEFIASPIFKTGTQNQMPEEKKSGMSGTARAVIWIIAILITLGLAAGAYFYLWPSTQQPVVTTEPTLTPGPTPELMLALEPTHASHFGFPNDIIPKVTITDYSIVAILTALQNEANNAGAAGGELREILLVDSNGQPITFSRFMTTLMPELITKNLEVALKEVFEDDFTSFLYFDDKGVWPGYSVDIKENVDIDIVTLQDQLKGLETSSFSNLFLTPPGTAQEFRAGTIKSVYTNRFASLSQAGASFNYGLFDGRLIINTSYDGLLEALELMSL